MFARYSASSTAAADDRDVLLAIKETVAGGATGHALAHEALLRAQTEILGAGSGGDDQRVAGVLAGIAGQFERPLLQLDGLNLVEHDFGLEALGVLAHPFHQIRPHQPFHIARPVVHLGGGGQLAAHLQAGDQ